MIRDFVPVGYSGFTQASCRMRTADRSVAWSRPPWAGGGAPAIVRCPQQIVESGVLQETHVMLDSTGWNVSGGKTRRVDETSRDNLMFSK
jgi:hypothetical protein